MSYHFEFEPRIAGGAGASEPEWDTAMNYGSDTAQQHDIGPMAVAATSSIIFTGKYLGFWTNDSAGHSRKTPRHPGYINWWKWNTQYGIEGAFPYIEAQKSTRQTIQADMSYYAEDFLGEHDIKFGVQYSMGRGQLAGRLFPGLRELRPIRWAAGGDTWPARDMPSPTFKAHTWYNYGGITMNDGLMFYN